MLLDKKVLQNERDKEKSVAEIFSSVVLPK
jgi:hypothetical protein